MSATFGKLALSALIAFAASAANASEPAQHTFVKVNDETSCLVVASVGGKLIGPTFKTLSPDSMTGAVAHVAEVGHFKVSIGEFPPGSKQISVGVQNTETPEFITLMVRENQQITHRNSQGDDLALTCGKFPTSATK